MNSAILFTIWLEPSNTLLHCISTNATVYVNVKNWRDGKLTVAMIGNTLSNKFYLRIGLANTRQQNIHHFFRLYNRKPILPIDIRFDLVDVEEKLNDEHFNKEVFDAVLSTAKSTKNPSNCWWIHSSSASKTTMWL